MLLPIGQKVKERAAEEKDRLAREQAAEQTSRIGLSSRSSSTGSVSSNSSITGYPIHHLHPNGGLPHHPSQHPIRPCPSPIQMSGPSLQASGMMNPFGDDLNKSWVPDPTLLPTPDGDLGAFANEYLNMSCSCNSMTGPCAQHREEMRVQLMSFMSSAQNQGHPMSNPKKSSFPNTMEDVMLDKMMQPGLPSPPLFPDMQTPVVDPPRPSGTAGLRRATVGSQSSGPMSPGDAASAAAAAATNTSRFKAILTFVRAAGFPDFDSMVTSYYTSNFQKNSVAELAQRSSRGRRLGQVLESLQESSSEWTVWESRGYREQVTDSAQGMYVQELEQVVKRAHRRQQQQHAMNTHANQDVMMFGVGDAEMHSEAPSGPGGVPSSLAALASGGAMPEEMQRVFQDNVSDQVFLGDQVAPPILFHFSLIVMDIVADWASFFQMPNLWALLTELAGTNGMQCDRVALAALLLLYNARQNPDVDMEELVPDWRNQEGLADLS